MLKADPHQTEFVDFYLPFNGRLKASNRWLKLAALVPWDDPKKMGRMCTRRQPSASSPLVFRSFFWQLIHAAVVKAGGARLSPAPMV